jgi:IS4 transposase
LRDEASIPDWGDDDPNRPVDVLKVDADEEGVGGEDAADALRIWWRRRGERSG